MEFKNYKRTTLAILLCGFMLGNAMTASASWFSWSWPWSVPQAQPAQPNQQGGSNNLWKWIAGGTVATVVAVAGWFGYKSYQAKQERLRLQREEHDRQKRESDRVDRERKQREESNRLQREEELKLDCEAREKIKRDHKEQKEKAERERKQQEEKAEKEKNDREELERKQKEAQAKSSDQLLHSAGAAAAAAPVALAAVPAVLAVVPAHGTITSQPSKQPAPLPTLALPQGAAGISARSQDDVGDPEISEDNMLKEHYTDGVGFVQVYPEECIVSDPKELRELASNKVYGVYTQRGTDRHGPINQDRVYCEVDYKNKRACFIVADGHGEHGHIIAHAITSKSKGLSGRMPGQVQSGEDLVDAIQQAYEDMDEALDTIGQQDYASSYTDVAQKSGAAVVSVNIYDNRVYLANAGDSRAILIDGSGKVVKSTKDHKPVDEEWNRIISRGGLIYNRENATRVFKLDQRDGRLLGGLAMTRSIGDKILRTVGVIPTPEVAEIDLKEQDAQFLIVASDGVWDRINNEVAADIVRKCQTPAQAARALVETARKNRSYDDITAIVVDLRALRTWQVQQEQQSAASLGSRLSAQFPSSTAASAVSPSAAASMSASSSASSSFASSGSSASSCSSSTGASSSISSSGV